MDQRLIALYDEYTHKPLPRREFLRRLTLLTGSVAAATAVLPLLENNYAHAQMVPTDDARIHTQRVRYTGRSGAVRAYLARPAESGKRPGVLVIHENRGLNPHIEDVARRFAVAGFLAVAPDGLSPLGGTPPDEDQARDLIRQLDRDDAVGDFVAGVGYLKQHPDCTGRVGCVGFCWGGSMSNQLAVYAEGLNAAVVFYGSSPEGDAVRRIQAPLLLHYAGLDERINAGVPDYEAALKRHGKRFTTHMYPGVNHAFHNDTNGARYDADAAKLAWDRTVAFFREQLG